MKKKLLFLTILFGLILIPKEVLAASLGLSCPSSVTVGENITCTLTANHETISGVKGSISFSGMSYQSVSNLTGSNYFSVSSSGFDGAIDIASGSKSLAQYVFTTSSAGTATINVSCSELIDGTNFDTHSCSGASNTITIKEKETQQPSNPTPSNPTPSNPQPQQPQQPQNNLSKNNNIKELSIEGYELEKIDNNNYTLTVSNNVTSINVNASAEDSKATVTGTGAHELSVGENNIEVVVTSESGAQNKINIKVTRKDGYYLEDLDSVLNNAEVKDTDIIINADSKISKEDISKIKDSGKTIRLNYFDENKKLIYSWTIDGKNIKDTNELITTISYTTENIKEIYKLSNYADGLYINFSHNGNLPKGTKIKLYVGDKFENESIVNVYHYNTTERTLDFIEDNLKVKESYIEFDIEHCSEYFVTMSNIMNNNKSEFNVFLIISIIELIIIIILIVLYFIKIKPNMNTKKDFNVEKTELELNNNDEQIYNSNIENNLNQTNDIVRENQNIETYSNKVSNTEEQTNNNQYL